MYQSYDIMEPTPAWNAKSFAVEQTPDVPVAGATSVEISIASITGMWSLRFGTFGCPESETRGGVVFVAPGALLGGDNNFAYQGEWTLDGTELTSSVQIIRHGVDSDLPTVFGTLESSCQFDCVAEAITPDLFEGRLRRPGQPDARIVMRRLADPVAAN